MIRKAGNCGNLREFPLCSILNFLCTNFFVHRKKNQCTSVQTTSPSNEEGPSTSIEEDINWLYANWLWDEGDLADFEGISDVETEEGQDDKFPNLQQSEEPLPDIPKKLSGIINLDSILKFNISRSHLWEGAVRGLNRKSFSPCNKVSVKFCDDVGTTEGAVDAGGPKREFFKID